MCDDIFGEENFIGVFVVNASPSAIDYGHVAKMHDYVLSYAKFVDTTLTVPLVEEDRQFKYEDDTGPFNMGTNRLVLSVTSPLDSRMPIPAASPSMTQLPTMGW